MYSVYTATFSPFSWAVFLTLVTSMPVAHTVNPYDTIEALIQQQERSHSQSQPSPVVVSSVAALQRLPSTPETPVKDRPRIRGRMTPYAFFVQQRCQLN